MKIELETIPVWDAVNRNSECFLCDLMAEAQKDGISFCLGSSVMNPETRVKVNEHGFCSKHWQLLSDANKAQGLALMTDTYLSTSRAKFKTSIDTLLTSKSPRTTLKAVKALKKQMEERERGCLVCSAMQMRLERYLATTCCLWNDDTAFRRALMKGKGVCLHHYMLLLEEAPTYLKGRQYTQFIHDLTELEEKNLDRTAQDVYWMTQKYKSENADKPWNGCEDAHKRCVDKLIGRYRVIDPV